MRLVALACSCLFFVASAEAAESDGETPLQMAREYFHLRGEKAILEAMIQLEVPQLKSAFKAANPGATDVVLDLYGRDVQKELEHGIDLEIELEAEFVADSYSPDDLKALVTFYRSPAGHRIADLTPGILRDQSVSQRQWIAKAAAAAVNSVNDTADKQERQP